MPHVSDVRATPPDHDHHDLLLVAALAAGDLAGTDRDHALDLTATCASCADLHDDLVAIARATADTPPPVATRPRDFQLTPADAARLRPSGWRRILEGLAGAQLAVTRPLGVGLATLGLVGLVVGNVPAFTFGGNAATPAAASATGGGTTSMSYESGGGRSAASTAPEVLQAGPAASAAASAAPVSDGNSFGAAGGPSPSSVTRSTVDVAVPTSRAIASENVQAQPLVPGTDKAAGTPAPALERNGTAAADGGPLRPLNLLFALAIVAGLGLLVLSRIRGRRSA